MKNLINKYRSLSFEEKTIFTTKISIYLNGIFAVGKFIMAFFGSFFLIAAAIVNIFTMLSKLECYLGERKNDTKGFSYRNRLIGLFLLLAGLEYGIYMARLIYTDVDLMKYDMIMGIAVACVSFVEMGIAIKGLFNAYGKGHYYRNIKLINLCSALTAMVLTEIAITSFASAEDTRFISGLFGVIVGGIIVLISIFIFIAPRVSILDKLENNYQITDNDIEDEINIQLTNSKFYGNFNYIGKKEGNIIKGKIIKGKSPIFKWNIYLLILVIILSEILIFPYAVGAFIFYLKSSKIINKLDNIMKEKGCIKIN